jgi:hypothetical protein
MVHRRRHDYSLLTEFYLAAASRVVVTGAASGAAATGIGLDAAGRVQLAGRPMRPAMDRRKLGLISDLAAAGRN